MEMNVSSHVELGNLLASLDQAKILDLSKFNFVSFLRPEGMYAVIRPSDVEVNTPITDKDIVIRFSSPISFLMFAMAIKEVFEKFQSAIVSRDPDESVN